MKTHFLRKVLWIWLVLISVACYAQETPEKWMPDPNLRKAVREEIGVPEGVPIAPEDITKVVRLNVASMNVRDLTGLERFVNLENIVADHNHIQDLHPLAGLTNLEDLYLSYNNIQDLRPLTGLTNLAVLTLNHNDISDISPLSGLTNLIELSLTHNTIADVSPLAGLVNLKSLWLWSNQIKNVSPLANLVKLETLMLVNNQIEDISPLVALTSLRELNVIQNWIVDLSPLRELTNIETLATEENPGSDLPEECALPRPSVIPRIQDRKYPSVVGSWAIVSNRPPVLPHPPWHGGPDAYAYFDLYFCCPEIPLHLKFRDTNAGVHLIGDFQIAKEQRDAFLAFNPNAIILVPVKYYSGVRPDDYPEDWPLWLRDENGNRIIDIWNEALVDFTLPETQKWAIDQAKAIAACGLFDGIFFDHWSEGQRLHGLRSLEAEHIARDNILQGIRAAVDDDFLIMVNTNEDKIPRWAEYINGTFMETYPILETPFEDLTSLDQRVPLGYTHADIFRIEQTLIWAETHFRKPRINSLKGFGLFKELPESPRNKQWMRLFTTMSLTVSDGYVEFDTGGAFYWYDFYDADLGSPVGKKAQRHTTAKGIPINGLFIREFTNGWAVYNRSGTAQEIEFSQEVSGWDSGVKNQRWHTLPDLDGEIYLKTLVQVEPGTYPPLYWINAKIGILQQLVDTEVKNLVSEAQNATSLAIDTANGKLYWTEKTGNRTGKIQSANLNGTNIQLVKDLTSAPLDITLDTAGGKLYLSNAWGKIQRMNLDGSNFQSNLITGLQDPQNLVLDSMDGKLYWTEQTGKTTGKIQRANLDGSNVQFVKELTSAPRGMTLDAMNRKLYLTNAWGKLQRMNLNGSNFESNLITGLASLGQVVVDRVGSKVYWTEQGKLRRADLNGENIQDVVTGLGELADLALGIQAVPMDVAAAPGTQAVPQQMQLLANYPNPFNPETWIPYRLSEPAEVTLRIYSVNGILIRTLALGHQPAGNYQRQSRAAYWDGKNELGESVASGIYFYTLTAGDFTATRKMLIKK